jgi:hypothetical protein
MVSKMDSMDRALLKNFKFLRKYAWIAVLEFSKPIKDR